MSLTVASASAPTLCNTVVSHLGLQPYKFHKLRVQGGFWLHFNPVKHQQSTSVNSPVPAECGKTFSIRSILTQHQLTHRGKKPYRYGDCSKSFSLSSNFL